MKYIFKKKLLLLFNLINSTKTELCNDQCVMVKWLASVLAVI